MFCVADDKSRVCLTEIPGVEGSDYINASFIDVCKTYIRNNYCIYYYSVIANGCFSGL